MSPALNDFLWGRCAIEAAAHDVSADAVRDAGGSVLLVPSSIKASHAVWALLDRLRLDHLVIDTHPGLNDETLLSIAVSDVLLLVLRPDRQDFQGTAVTAEVARRLGVPELRLVANKYAPWLDRDALCRQVEATYGAPVAGMFAHTHRCRDVAREPSQARNLPFPPM